MRISDWSSDLCSSDLFMLGQYYRFQWSSLLSFGHRLTGIGLTFGTALLAIWLIAIAAGPQWYDAVSPHLHAWYGRSEERRVGEECVSPCRSRWWPLHKKKTSLPNNLKPAL